MKPVLTGGMRRRSAFTLIELLVVLAIVGVLAALLLPSLSTARQKAAQVTCINNLRQLGLGMKLYVDGSNDTFPGLASFHNGFHPEDWIYWRTNSAFYPSVEKSPIIRSLANPRPTLLRCPLDRNDSDRLAYYTARTVDGPYFYSYSFNGYGLNLDPGGYSLDGERNYGMASVFAGSIDQPIAYPFKESRVRSPALKIMLAEEPGSYNPKDNAHPQDQQVIQDGRWQGNVDPLTVRHSGKADVTFADGHVQAVTWQFASDPANSQPDR
jgi:prepilin-type N-terminal cleavage/methylation domain-containing protein/prepilin-type processing-associated H-X9-DG protein